MQIFEKVFREFNKVKLKYLVAGGVAVNLHGYLRFTGDLDILLLLEDENLAKMDKVMRKLGYQERLPVSVMSLKDHNQVKKWLREKNMTAYAYYPPVGNPLAIDILTEESLNFTRAYKKSLQKRFDGVNVPVVSIEDLIGMKKKANRPKDLEDLKALIKLKNYE